MNNIDFSNIVLYTVDDIQEMFRLGRTRAYELMSADGFPAFRLNRKVYVERGKLMDWVNKMGGKTFSY